MIKKVLAAVLMVVVMLLSVVSASADYYNEGNDGSSWATAYIIDSLSDLQLMSERTSDFPQPESGKYYKLTADIDLPASWYPCNFVGHFDGQNHTIRVNVNRTEDESSYSFAIFSQVSGDSIIRNLNVEGSIKATAYSAGIVSELKSGTLENCSFKGSIELTEKNIYAIISAGGLVWRAGYYTASLPAVIKDCTFQGTITVSGATSTEAGGIAAGIYGGRIENCTVLSGSKISVNSESADNYGHAGGIVAYVGSGMSAYGAEKMSYGVCYVTDCTSYAELDGNCMYKGGIAGYSSGYNPDRAEAHLSGNKWPETYPQVGNEPQSNTPSTPGTPAESEDHNAAPNTPSSGGQSEIASLNGHRYQVFDRGLTWTEAKAYCESLGGYLAAISSQEEQNVVQKLVLTRTRNSYWLGGHKDSSVSWSWVDDSSWSYTNWSAGQPDSNSANDSLIMYRVSNPSSSSQPGTWDNIPDSGIFDPQEFFGTENLGFVCEWDTEDTEQNNSDTPTTSSDNTPQNPGGSGGGCNSGISAILLAATAAFTIRKR